jgi:hypothetical protein
VVVKNYVPLFESKFLELFATIRWYEVFVLWTSVILYLFYNGIFGDYEKKNALTEFVWRGGAHFSYFYVFLTVLSGLLIWTITEYTLHRFLFHSE